MSRSQYVRITDPFWLKYRNLVRHEMIPYQWKVLNDEIDVNIERERDDASIPNEKSHAMENFRIAAGISSGHHYGWIFQDSDVYKWLEAAAYSLSEEMDEQLKAEADSVVDLIAQAQEEDGYLGTYFTIEEPERRFKSLVSSHELYCAGHFMEAAAAYYEATGSQKVLDIAKKLARCIDKALGPDGEFGYDGHEEIEIGLMKLYHLTGDESYMKLSRHFLMIRGTDRDFFGEQRKTDPGKKPLIPGMENLPRKYFQVHAPVTEQDTAEGHAVRLIYLCTAMADVAASSHDSALFSACRKIWRNIVDRRMYITGGIGSTVHGEAFTFDYDLPDDTMYCETCASVGLMFFARQMLRNEEDGEYGDVMERALYNTVLSGTALDGKHFFYVNPLEADPASSAYDPGKSHVKPVRPQWLGCACCPPNLARLLASLDRYVYTLKEGTCLVNLYMDSTAELTMEMPEDGQTAGAGPGNAPRKDGACFEDLSGPDGSMARMKIRITQKTDYPKSGEIRLIVETDGIQPWRLGLRIPGWAENFEVSLNGKNPDSDYVAEKGYLYFSNLAGVSEICLRFDMTPCLWRADLRVKDDVGKVALARGPVVYCLEEADNGKNLHLLSVDRNSRFEEIRERGELGDIVVITASGRRYTQANTKEEENKAGTEETGSCKMKPANTEKRKSLYMRDADLEIESGPATLRFIPYYTWANRGSNEMSVWVRAYS